MPPRQSSPGGGEDTTLPHSCVSPREERPGPAGSQRSRRAQGGCSRPGSPRGPRPRSGPAPAPRPRQGAAPAVLPAKGKGGTEETPPQPPTPRPGLLGAPQAAAPSPARAPLSPPPLRVVLVEVGEEQMAATGVAALPGQVHGGTALATPVRRGEDEETPPEGCAPQPRPPRPRRIPAGPLFTRRAAERPPRLRPEAPPGHRTASAPARGRMRRPEGVAKLSRLQRGRRWMGDSVADMIPGSGVSPLSPGQARPPRSCHGGHAVTP